MREPDEVGVGILLHVVVAVRVGGGSPNERSRDAARRRVIYEVLRECA